ncbi:MAG: hypothetical protein ACI88A_002041 [Paraglaciecola sp.]|jgi:hypothetical protein
MKYSLVKPTRIAFIVILISSFMLPSVGQAKDFNLIKSCQSLSDKLEEHADSACYVYIQGFLDGAVLTDSKIMQEIDKRSNMSEFSQRVIRNRLGMQRGSSPDTYLAEFCLATEKASKQDILTVIRIVQSSEAENIQPGDLIYDAVRTSFPCSREIHN